MKAAESVASSNLLPVTPAISNPFTTPPQAEVAASGILKSGFNCVLQMPTGSGKTWLAEREISETVSSGYRSIFLTPLRALAEELLERWRDSMPANCPVGIFTGDYGKAGKPLPVNFRDARLLIMTPERLDLCTRNWRSHWGWIPEVDLLVADEIHLLGDASRGPRLEGAISRFRRLNPFARFLGLSATMGNRHQLADWLGGVEYGSGWRPVPLTWKTVRYRKATDKPDLLADAVNGCIREGGQSLVFVQSRRRAEALCQYLKSKNLASGHHHAGLLHEERKNAEAEFRSGKLKILVTTSTLEMGINLPARQVVLYDLQEFNGIDYASLSVNTVWQRAGRAGRLGKDDAGEVVLFASSWESGGGGGGAADSYEAGNFEPIVSGLDNPKMLAEQIVAEVGSGLARTERQLKAAFSTSLAACQNRLPHFEKTIAELFKAKMLVSVLQSEDAAQTAIRSIESSPAETASGNQATTPEKQQKVSKNTGDIYRLKVTRLGKVAVRHLLYPSTVILFQKAFDSDYEFSFFDLLLLIAASEDCEPRLPVDFEELDSLANLLSGEVSCLLQCSQMETGEILGINGKRLLSALKTALTLRSFTRFGDVETTAVECNCYPFEVQKLIESAVRLLGAALEILNISEESGKENNETDLVPAETEPLIKAKIKALSLMVQGGLDEQTATLTLIKGIGAQTAKKLKVLGCHDIEDLAAADASELCTRKGISPRRANFWVRTAQKLQKQYSAFYFRESGLPIASAIEAWSPDVEPYRMRRALELKVSGGDGGIYRVSGGLEPHTVRSVENRLSLCDCADAEKGNLCKHVLAVRLYLHDPLIKKLAGKLQAKERDKNAPLDLYSLWLKRQ